MKVNDISFGKNLKKFRDDNELSMEELCKKYNEKFSAKLNKSTLSRYENGLQEPLFSTVANLAELFQVSIDELLSNASTYELYKWSHNGQGIPSIQKKVSDEDIMFALWGDATDIDKKDLDDVKRYADFVRERKKKK